VCVCVYGLRDSEIGEDGVGFCDFLYEECVKWALGLCSKLDLVLGLVKIFKREERPNFLVWAFGAVNYNLKCLSLG
jgi:hypothetical protein